MTLKLVASMLKKRAASSLLLTRRTSSSTEVGLADRLENKTTPWLMLTPEVDPTTGEKLDRFYSLADSKIVKLNRKKSLKVPDTCKPIASTLGSWLGFADTKDGALYLSNPFSNGVVELPSMGTLPRVVGVERDSNGSVIHFKVAHPDSGHNGWDHPEFDGLPWVVAPKRMAEKMFHLALSDEDPRCGACVAMAVQGQMRRLAYCKASMPDSNNKNNNVWYGLQEDYLVTDLWAQVVYSFKNGMFYSICEEGIQAFDVHRDRGRRTKNVGLFKMDRLEKQRKEGLPKWLENMECRVEYYLVTLFNGDLWLIVRHLDDDDENNFHQTLHFDVFRVAYPGKLERVTYLEDRAIFIGSNQSFYVQAGAASGVRPNSIYFTDDLFLDMYETTHDRKWGHDMGIFCMEDGVITQFYPYQDEQEEKKLPFTTPLLWIAPRISKS